MSSRWRICSDPFVARHDGSRTVVFPVTSSADEPPLAIAGSGDAVWVMSSGTLQRYVHDPLVSFP